MPFSKVKDDHSVVANCQVYWRGWVNTEHPLRPLALKIKTKLQVEQSIVLNVTTNKWGEACFNPWESAFHGLSV